jgi:hypothetical protein
MWRRPDRDRILKEDEAKDILPGAHAAEAHQKNIS